MQQRPILRLRQSPQRLDRDIDMEGVRRPPDAVRVVRLKKFKLALKGRMIGLRFAKEQPDFA